MRAAIGAGIDVEARSSSRVISSSVREPIATQAFFGKLVVMDDDSIDGEAGEPFNVFLSHGVQSTAVRPARTDDGIGNSNR